MSNKTFTKRLSKKHGELEIELQQIAVKYNFAPRIFMITHEHDESLTVDMQDLGKNTLYDIYGDNPEDVPDRVWESIRFMLRVLYEEEGIEYIDITPYNFMEVNDRVYVIDFGHARYYNEEIGMNWFLQLFLDGSNEWNPDFR